MLRAGKIRASIHRWTAGFLFLIMLAPAFEPLALARVAPMAPAHCMRRHLQSVSATQAAPEPVMPCHHGAVHAPVSSRPEAQTSAANSAAPETAIRSLDCCCSGNHCCCSSMSNSGSASLVSSRLHVSGLRIEPVRAAAVLVDSLPLDGPDSTRAPPRS